MLVVPLAVAALVLAIAGASKVRNPAPTAGALRGMGLPSDLALVRFLGVGEVVLGTAALVVDEPALAWALAAAYLSFTAFAAVALRRGTKLQSCGCFGGLEVPPTAMHVAIDLLVSAALVAAAVRGTRPVYAQVDVEPWAGAPLLAATVLAAGLVVVLLTVLPMALAEARR